MHNRFRESLFIDPATRISHMPTPLELNAAEIASTGAWLDDAGAAELRGMVERVKADAAGANANSYYTEHCVQRVKQRLTELRKQALPQGVRTELNEVERSVSQLKRPLRNPTP
jgi:hypothetical protein